MRDSQGKGRGIAGQRKESGVIRLRSFRPFPFNEILKACRNLEGLAVIDRHVSLGMRGPLFSEIKAMAPQLNAFGYIAALGGRDITLKHFEEIFSDLLRGKQSREWLV